MSPLFAVVFLLGLSGASPFNFTSVYQWREIDLDYVWPTQADKAKALEDEDFRPKNILLYYMSAYKDRIFLQFTEYIGVPVTLVSLPASSNSFVPPKLAPFPSWQHYNSTNECNSIQDPKGMDVDSDGRLWVVEDSSDGCPPGIWIFDLEDNDKLLLVHRFPETVVPLSGRLHDIVLDQTPDDTIAYIADTSDAHIIAFSLKNKESWSVKTQGKILGAFVLFPAKGSKLLYFGVIESAEFYSVPVSQLRTRNQEVKPQRVATWIDRPYRLFFIDDVLYATFFNTHHISSWNTSEPFNELRIYEGDGSGSNMPFFSFALDKSRRTLWMIEQRKNPDKPKLKLFKSHYLERASEVSTASPTSGSATGSVERSNGCGRTVEDNSKGRVLIDIIICIAQQCSAAGNVQKPDSQSRVIHIPVTVP